MFTARYVLSHITQIWFVQKGLIVSVGSQKLRPFNDDFTFRHRASCILGEAFHYSPENAFYIFNQKIYFII